MREVIVPSQNAGRFWPYAMFDEARNHLGLKIFGRGSCRSSKLWTNGSFLYISNDTCLSVFHNIPDVPSRFQFSQNATFVQGDGVSLRLFARIS